MPALLLIMDGVGDRGKETPLSSAKTPYMDELAATGIGGFVRTVAGGFVPGSDTAHLSLFGYDPHKFYRGRGPFEALGAGMEMGEGDVAFRTNLCTVDESGIIVDRRAGRKDVGFEELYRAIGEMEIEDVKVKVQHTVEHRGALVMSGKGLLEKVGNTDPHETGKPIMESVPLAEGAEKTARVLNEFTKRACEILASHEVNKQRESQGLKPANAILCRGAGIYQGIIPIRERFGIRAVCIAGGALYKGAARYVGMDVLDVPGATGTAETDLTAKARAAVDAAPDYDFVFLHVKATDAFGHDGDFDGKRRMIEKVDAEIIPRVHGLFDVIVVTGDHTTAVTARRHTADPVPFLFWHRDVRRDEVTKLSEQECARGILGHIAGLDVMPMILDYLDKSTMFGE